MTASSSELRLVRTSRLLLRAPTVDDEEVLFAIHSDPATNRHNPDGPMRDRSTARGWITGLVTNWDKDGIAYWCVSLVDKPTVIGFAGIEIHQSTGLLPWLREPPHREVFNLYYRLTPTAWGKGYATEAADMAVKAGRMLRADLPIVARTRISNVASIRVAEKVGLVRRPDLDESDRIVLVSDW